MESIIAVWLSQGDLCGENNCQPSILLNFTGEFLIVSQLLINY